MHKRTQIRNEIVTTLTGLTTTGSNVFRSKVYNLDPVQLPCLTVYTNADAVTDYMMSAPRTQKRTLTVLIKAVAGLSDDVDVLIDTICEEVETAMAGNLQLSGLATSIYLQATDISYQSEGDRPYGIADITYEVGYTIFENQPGG